MARFRFVTPRKKSETTSSKRVSVSTGFKKSSSSGSSSMSIGMLKRLEPVLDLRRKITPVLLKPKGKSCKGVHENPEKKNKIVSQERVKEGYTACRELFPQNAEKTTSKGKIPTKQDHDGHPRGCNADIFVPRSSDRVADKSDNMSSLNIDGAFKKPKGFPVYTAAKQKKMNREVIDTIRKTQESIAAIRYKANAKKCRVDEDDFFIESSQCPSSKTRKEMLNVQVSVYLPKQGIRKSQCTVQQSGSMEEEHIGYKQEHLVEQQIIDLL